MKKLTILCIGILCFFQVSLIAQNANTSLTIFHYKLEVTDEFRPMFPSLGEKWSNFQEGIKRRDPVKTGTIDNVYATIENQLQTVGNYNVADVNALKNTKGKKVRYSANNYPVGRKKAAISHNTSEQYAVFFVDMSPRRTKGNRENIQAAGFSYDKEAKKIKPAIAVTCILYDSNGKKIGRYRSSAVAKDFIELRSATMLKVKASGEQQRLQDEQNQVIITQTVEAAMNKLMAKMK